MRAVSRDGYEVAPSRSDRWLEKTREPNGAQPAEIDAMQMSER